jgi:opacity protein-like surface antigen
MKNHTIYLKFLTVSLIISLIVPNSIAQENETKSLFASNSAGISLGWYNPALDYWKEQSEFKDADFNGAIYVRGFYDFRFAKNFHGQLGLGYWQSSTEADLQGFGNTKLLLTGIPISFDVLYHIEPLKFSLITPYVGLGGEYTFLQYKLNFEQKDNPDPVSGSTFLGNGIVGLEAKLSENFALDLEFRYKFGSYNQEFKRSVTNPENPEEPTYEIVEEKIKLNGPSIGLSLKYLF